MSAEFLQGFTSEKIKSWYWQEMLANNKIIKQDVLVDILTEASQFLVNTPGPNQETRIKQTPNWIGWWVEYLKAEKYERGTLSPFEKIKEKVAKIQKQDDCGVLFAGGLEGHEGHRLAVSWMLHWVYPVLLLEPDSYVQKKERGGRFLPLEVLLSMWAYFDPKTIISVLPEMPIGADESVYYQGLFDSTGAKYCFASEIDPLAGQKRARGENASFTLIKKPVKRTTDMVEKLFPDNDIEEIERILTTTERTKRLLPKSDKEDIKKVLDR